MYRFQRLQHGHIAGRFFVKDIGHRHHHHTAAADGAQLVDRLENLAALDDDIDRVPVRVLLADDDARDGRPLQPGDGWLARRSAAAMASGEVPRILAKMARFSLARRCASKNSSSWRATRSASGLVFSASLLAISAACEGWISPSASGLQAVIAQGLAGRDQVGDHIGVPDRGGRLQRAFGRDQRVADAAARPGSGRSGRDTWWRPAAGVPGVPAAGAGSAISCTSVQPSGTARFSAQCAKAQAVVQHQHAAVLALALLDHINAR